MQMTIKYLYDVSYSQFYVGLEDFDPRTYRE